MSKLKWDEDGEKLWFTGVKNVVLFPKKSDGTYDNGVAWNGVTKITDKPTGAEVKYLYADDSEYCTLTTKEKFEGTIEAYMYPDEFAECDGSKEVATGMKIQQQGRKEFALCYTTTIGNDLKEIDYGYEIVFVYNCKASVAQQDHSTIGEEVDPQTMSWDFKTTQVKPEKIADVRPTSTVRINSTTVDPDKLAALEAIIYGDENSDSTLPSVDDIYELITGVNP